MGWAALGESITGTSHRVRKVPCQDAFRFRTFGPTAEWIAIVTADGAGSASHSEIGATLVCDEFVRQVEAIGPDKLFIRDDMNALFTEARSALFAEAERLNLRPRELACTAVFAIVGPASAAFAQLGALKETQRRR